MNILECKLGEIEKKHSSFFEETDTKLSDYIQTKITHSDDNEFKDFQGVASYKFQGITIDTKLPKYIADEVRKVYLQNDDKK